MFTIPSGSVLTKDIIVEAIKYNEKSVPKYNDLEAYYTGEHPILARQKIDRFKNHKVVVNHAEYITDLKVAYFCGNPIRYTIKEEYGKEEALKPVLNEYEEQDISTVDQELAIEVSKFGEYYERIYLDGNDVRSTLLDVRNCVFIYDDTVMHTPMYVVIYNIKDKSKKDIIYSELTVLDNTNIYNWLGSTGVILDSATSIVPHNFKQIPVIKYQNNRAGTGDYEKITTLIDAYNVVISDRVNDKVQLVESILAIKGMEFTADMASSLKDNRIIANIPVNGGGVEYVTKELNEEQLHILKKDIEDDIFKISKTPNMTDENFIGNSSGVALKYKLLPFELATTNKETYFKKGLRQRFMIYNEYLRGLSASNELQPYMLNIEFKRSLPQNDFETSQTIANVSGKVSDEKLVSQLSFVENPEEEVKKARQQEKDRTKDMAGEFATNNPTSDNSESTSDNSVNTE